MSRIAKSPIELPAGVDFTVKGDLVTVKSGKASMDIRLHPDVAVVVEDKVVKVSPKDGEKPNWAMAGTTRALLNNMVVGVKSGFQRKLELVGVGYRAQGKGKVLNLSLGFSHPVTYKLPEGISASVDKNRIVLSGIDKELLGATSATIRKFRGPEPYKGKGIKYVEEQIRRKVGKSVGK